MVFRTGRAFAPLAALVLMSLVDVTLLGVTLAVTMADRIIVMDAGLVQAIGTHAELVAASPLYAELAATQFLVAST